jgi:hypothetical protein
MIRRKDGRSLGDRIYNALFYFFGPAQVGTRGRPEREPPPPDDPTCVQCGQPMSLHRIVRGHGSSYPVCPTGGAHEAGPAAG